MQISQSALRTQFIYPATETVEDPVSDDEDRILAAYLPNEADEPEAESPVPPPVTPLHILKDYSSSPSKLTHSQYQMSYRRC